MRRRSPVPASRLTALVVLALAALIFSACGQTPRASVSPSPASASPTSVAGWRTITPPWPNQTGANTIERYIVSPDVSGLIVACYGESTSPPNQGLSGTARLWRTRDDGAHWQAVSSTLSLDECGELTMIAGGNGLLTTFRGIDGGPNGAGVIRVSPDAGDTWRTVSSFLPDEIAANRFTAMQQAVYRDGSLYASLIFNAAIGRVFSVSDDYGSTWKAVEQVPTPAPGEMPLLTEEFAPDYSAPHAWFRYTEHGPLNVSLPHYTTLDRSTDDGRTWAAISKLDANGAVLPEYGRPLATDPQQPSRLCVGLQVPDPNSLVSLPWDDLVLGASDDAGITWHYTTISHRQQDGRSGDPEPLIDALGNCYVTLAPQGRAGGNVIPTSPNLDTSILRLAPGSVAQPAAVATLTRQFGELVSVFPTSQPGQLNLSVLASPIPSSGSTDYVPTNLLVSTIAG